jgi:hypothetical protein
MFLIFKDPFQSSLILILTHKKKPPPYGDCVVIAQRANTSIKEDRYDIVSGERGFFGNTNGLLKKSSLTACSKRTRCKALEILRSEEYLALRRNDEGPAVRQGKRRRWSFISKLLEPSSHSLLEKIDTIDLDPQQLGNPELGIDPF